MRTQNRENALKRYLGEERYNDLKEFYMNTWFSNTTFRYRVFLAQKSANINEILYNETLQELQGTDSKKADKLVSIRERSFLSQDGLLVKAEEFAQEYYSGWGFPELLFIDEAGRTGGDLSELYYSLECAVLDALATIRGEEIEWSEVLRVRDDLRASVEFRVFMLSDKKLLMESNLADRVRYAFRVPEEEIYRFTYDISRAITITPYVENSAIVPTFYVPYKDYMSMENFLRESGVWHCERWRYRDTTSIIWDKQRSSGDEVKLSYFVRATFMPLEGKYALTAYPFWGELGKGGYKRFIDVIIKKLQECDRFDQFCEILNLDLTAYNFMYFIVSVLTMTTFIEDTKCTKTSFPQNDLNKICQYFGTQEELEDEFDSFIGSNKAVHEFRKALRNEIETFLLNNAGALSHVSENIESTLKNDAALYQAERYFGARSLEEQGDKYRKRKQSIRYISGSAFENLFENSLDCYLARGKKTIAEMRKMIGAVLLLCQQGYIGIKQVGADLTDGTNCDFLLKTGESTESLRYQHMYRFMPALIRFDRICKQNGLNTEELVEKFGDALYTVGDNEPGLGKIFRAFLEEHHKQGIYLEPHQLYGLVWNLSVPNKRNQVRTFAEWSGRPWSETEWEQFDALSRSEYMDWEQDKQIYYENAVVDFFDQY